MVIGMTVAGIVTARLLRNAFVEPAGVERRAR